MVKMHHKFSRARSARPQPSSRGTSQSKQVVTNLSGNHQNSSTDQDMLSPTSGTNNPAFDTAPGIGTDINYTSYFGTQPQQNQSNVSGKPGTGTSPNYKGAMFGTQTQQHPFNVSSAPATAASANQPSAMFGTQQKPFNFGGASGTGTGPNYMEAKYWAQLQPQQNPFNFNRSPGSGTGPNYMGAKYLAQPQQKPFNFSGASGTGTGPNYVGSKYWAQPQQNLFNFNSSPGSGTSANQTTSAMFGAQPQQNPSNFNSSPGSGTASNFTGAMYCAQPQQNPFNVNSSPGSGTGPYMGALFGSLPQYSHFDFNSALGTGTGIPFEDVIFEVINVVLQGASSSAMSAANDSTLLAFPKPTIDAPEEDLEGVNEDDVCRVCISRRIAKKAFVPCGHAQLCPVCISAYKPQHNCPICRQKIDMIINIY